MHLEVINSLVSDHRFYIFSLDEAQRFFNAVPSEALSEGTSSDTLLAASSRLNELYKDALKEGTLRGSFGGVMGLTTGEKP